MNVFTKLCILIIFFFYKIEALPSLPSAQQSGLKRSSYNLPQVTSSAVYAPQNSRLERILTPKNQQYYLQPENIYSDGQDQYENQDQFVVKPAPQTMNSMLLPPVDSVMPKMSGGILSDKNSENVQSTKQSAIINPAAFYLQGANLNRIPPSTCRLMGCQGPVPNDSDFLLQQQQGLNHNNACHNTFVPMNGCVDGRGYPMGMICQICCDCTNEFVYEMKNTLGYINGYKSK